MLRKEPDGLVEFSVRLCELFIGASKIIAGQDYDKRLYSNVEYLIAEYDGEIDKVNGRYVIEKNGMKIPYVPSMSLALKSNAKVIERGYGCVINDKSSNTMYNTHLSKINGAIVSATIFPNYLSGKEHDAAFITDEEVEEFKDEFLKELGAEIVSIY